MADSGDKSQGMRPPPFDSRGHPLPRRASPDKSITLHNHRLARDASSRVTSSSALGVTEPQPQPQPTSSPTRRSSGESNDTGQSDPKNWFDQSNRNPVAAFHDESPNMEVDPPFYQKETDSSNEESRYPPGRNPSYPPGGTQMQGFRPAVAHSTAADDFRSVIDDLTVENKRLKEELKRYKQFGSDMMRKEKLFEIKVHGLPKRKKRELEATLRDFAASLGDSSKSTSQRRKTGRHGKAVHSSGLSLSKHDSSSSSRSRPVDSAYATMSTGRSSHAPPRSSGPSLGRPSLTRAKSTSSQKVESYLRDTPDGLLPHHIVMTDKEKKKLVVRRLEQLFTGKISGRNMQRNQSMPSIDAPLMSEGTIMAPPRPPPEGLREACIQVQEGENPQKNRSSQDNASASNSGADQTVLGGTGTGSGDGSGSGGPTGNNTSPPGAIAPDQRPTRPRDLDPDRVQIPSENMDYIRHLGLVSPEFLQGSRTSYQDVAPDAEGWVYLNLLCNLAQLHMVSVTPSFIRRAVSEKSTKFQLSSDGRKIRWRGGTDGTKFSSDSSEDKSQKSPLTEDTEDGSDKTGRRKKRKTEQARSEIGTFGPSRSPSSDTFHYKPMFLHRHSSSVETSLEESASQGSEDVVDESNLGNSKWDFSGSGTTQQRRKRRYDGAIVYYSGVPFCTDLSGDPGDMSPTAQMTATGRELEGSGSSDEPEHVLQRTLSGSSLPFRPLSHDRARVAEALDFDPENAPDLVADDGFAPNDEDFVFPWCEDPAKIQIQPLAKEVMEPSGLGGVLPDDHFAMVVTTRRVIRSILQRQLSRSTTSEDTADIIAERLASIRTSSPLPPRSRSLTVAPMQIEYVSGEFRRLNPTPLPPPAMFYPPFSTDSSWDDGDDLASDDEVEEVEEDSFSEGQISRRANPHFSDNNTYMRKDDLVFDTETDVRMDSDDNRMSSDSGLNLRSVMPRTAVDGDDSPLAAAIGKDVDMLHTGSSVATAGGAESGYSSSIEDVSSS